MFNSSLAITIDDTTFFPKEKDTYLWNTTKAYFPIALGFMINLTIESIYKGKDGPFDAMIVNCTLIQIDTLTDTRFTEINNSFYMASNHSENYLRYQIIDIPYIFMTILPLNLTLIGEFLKNIYSYSSYNTSGKTLTLIGGTMINQQTYNSNGILTKSITHFLNGTLVGEMILVNGVENNNSIPLGNSLIVMIFVSIVVIVYITKKKIK